MKKDDKIFILHIRDSIDKIQKYTTNISQTEFNQNSMMQDAVIRQLEIIGEASKNLSVEFKNNYEFVPWKRMIGMRNKVIHEYFGVQQDLVWEALANELPLLKTTIDKLIADLATDTPMGI